MSVRTISELFILSRSGRTLVHHRWGKAVDGVENIVFRRISEQCEPIIQLGGNGLAGWVERDGVLFVGVGYCGKTRRNPTLLLDTLLRLHVILSDQIGIVNDCNVLENQVLIMEVFSEFFLDGIPQDIDSAPLHLPLSSGVTTGVGRSIRCPKGKIPNQRETQPDIYIDQIEAHSATFLSNGSPDKRHLKGCVLLKSFSDELAKVGIPFKSREPSLRFALHPGLDKTLWNEKAIASHYEGYPKGSSKVLSYSTDLPEGDSSPLFLLCSSVVNCNGVSEVRVKVTRNTEETARSVVLEIPFPKTVEGHPVVIFEIGQGGFLVAKRGKAFATHSVRCHLTLEASKEHTVCVKYPLSSSSRFAAVASLSFEVLNTVSPVLSMAPPNLEHSPTTLTPNIFLRTISHAASYTVLINSAGTTRPALPLAYAPLAITS
eukprot:TRINITY_DN18963_c0_g1_i1.p1 TRINITY_DN18963_c0_g1~~TRINITY_DN18963_c0_g1_i1.p1  ORF type:complete len:431 (+),score=41.87 TRINITY_DN18963_c0_g1_i1:363-1655(+)